MTDARVLESRSGSSIQATPAIWTCVYVLIAVAAGAVVWVVGHRGLFLCDQSGVFDGGWRLMQGQVMYRDFYTPYPPVTFLIQWLFFRIVGVDFSAMVLAAAAVNVVAASCVMRIIRRVLPDAQFRPAALAGGVLTAVWFQAPAGTLWFEQTSFLFNLVALTLMIETTHSSERTAAYLRVAAGCSLAVAILSKQTAGTVLLPVPLATAVMLSLPRWRKTILEISAGMLLVFALFGLWLVAFSSPTGFWRSVIVMSRELGASRGRGLRSLAFILHVKSTWEYVWKAITLVFIFAVSRVAFRSALAKVNVAMACWLILGYIFFENMFAALTLNEPENSIGFLGLINGLAFGLCLPVMWRPKFAQLRIAGLLMSVPLMVVSAYYIIAKTTFYGWTYSATRIVQQFDQPARFSERVNVRGASRLVWGDPTFVGPGRGPKMELTRKDFENVNAWLAKANTNFFVFPDSTLLYGLHHKVSPQPWLYFFEGHSFRESDLPQIDVTILRSLQKNKVGVVVLEKVSYLENHKLLHKMPQLDAWIHNNFEKTAEFGMYEVWVLRSGQPSAS
jgi:Dolichyl-phosphate-mannose-protein mannosyltransferase